ncbi:hypothetical protein [Desulfotalea psychrophila]|nr:hypothetical protein [Desulfotalea psychrophila]
MIHLDDLKAFVHFDREKKVDTILPLITTLIAGLVIILSISPEYLRELNPITLFLLSVACALPVWSLNQLLWWHLGRKISSELVGKIVYIFDISGKEKKVLSFALGQLMTALDIMRFIPSKNIANLVTVLTIYLAAAVIYFTSGSPALLYGIIFLLSLIIWLGGWYALHRSSRKIDVKPLKNAWEQLKDNEELLANINKHFEKIEEMVLARASLLGKNKDEVEAESREEATQREKENGEDN